MDTTETQDTQDDAIGYAFEGGEFRISIPLPLLQGLIVTRPRERVAVDPGVERRRAQAELIRQR